jgi:hypothetical protein
VTAPVDACVRRYRVESSDKELDGLRSRIAAMRWPERETVTDDSQGVPLAGRLAHHRHARLAGICPRTAQDHRVADKPDRAQRGGFGCLPHGDPLTARTRILAEAAGVDPVRIARAWVVLMKRLGYQHFVAQGGDWGAAVTQAKLYQAPKSWAERAYPNNLPRQQGRPWRPLRRLEQPALFSGELRAAVRALRSR